MSLASKPGALGAIARFWSRTYTADYITLGVLCAIWAGIHIFGRPFHRMFYLDNLAIQYPFAEVERVPVFWNVVYAGVIPFFVLVLWSIMFQTGIHKAHVTILGFLVTLALTVCLTDIIKDAVGRPRPDLLSRCRPRKGTPDHSLVTFTVCTQTNQHLIDEGWRSFPSGHSSFAFGGLGYLALVFAGQMHALRPRTDLARCLLALAPLMGALMIAISRCEDYRHDVWDVTCGSLLGMGVAYFSYRRYYPALRSVRCDVPFDKSDAPTAEGFSELSNDEERQGFRNIPERADWDLDDASYALRETASERIRQGSGS